MQIVIQVPAQPGTSKQDVAALAQAALASWARSS